MHIIAVGVDSETIRGKPFTFQFYSEELKRADIVWLKSPKTATKLFLGYLDSLPDTRDRTYVFFGHNLAFDFVSFVYDRHSILRDESVNAEWYGWKVEIIYAHVKFAKLTKKRKVVWVIDTFAYFVRSLADIADMVCPHLPKLKMPKGLGKKRFNRKNKKFCDYAMRDSEIAYHCGKQILELHKEMDVPISVSAPHFASRVFRKTFMRKPIPLPPRKIVYASLASYHGGKNNVTVPIGYYKKTYSLDIKSAYPYAMASFPSFTNHTLYRSLSGKGTPKSFLPPFGIYKISGTAKPCKWPILFDHSFKPIQGDFENIWTTGFELNEALRMGELSIRDTYGYFYDAQADKEYSPFHEYVGEFFKRKEIKDQPKIKREFWKLLLNALYGKFIQTRSLSTINELVFDIDENKIMEDSAIVAGGLFNPFIASLITGHTRAYIHRLEHEYRALHTSTDGIQTQKKPKEISGLGGLSVEASGDSLIFRNKLYIMYGSLTTADRRIYRADKKAGRKSKIIPSSIYPKKKIIKYALHGFLGTVYALEKMYKTKVWEYEYVKVNKLKESLRRNLAVNDFVKSTGRLHLSGGK